MATERQEQIRHLNEVLEKWRGAHAQFWSYTAALATLEIRLFFERRIGNIHLVCSPCVSITGPVYWDRCELTVRDDPCDETLLVVRDEGASVRVVCRQLYTFENVEPLFAPLCGLPEAAKGKETRAIG
jgi:hypothetical protein